MAKKSAYDLGDLGDLPPPLPKVAEPEPVPGKKVKAVKPKPEKKKSKKELKAEAEAAAAAAEAAAKAEAEAAAKKKSKAKKPKAEKPKAEKPKPKPRVPSLPAKRPAPSKAPVEADANAGPIGVALGAAPLVAAPFVALAATRGTLQRTQARRAKIQEEIYAFEVAKAKKQVQADVDGATLGKALGLFGGAGAALALVLAAPFSSFEAPPTSTAPKPAVQKTVKAAKTKLFETKAPSVVATPTKKAVKTKKVARGPYDLDLEERVVEEEAVAAEDAASARAAAEAAKKAKADAKAAERAAKEKVSFLRIRLTRRK